MPRSPNVLPLTEPVAGNAPRDTGRVVRRLIREGYLRSVSHGAFATYVVLHDLVWRSAEQGSKRARTAYAEGVLAALVSLEHVAERLGSSRSAARRYVEELEARGWIERRVEPGASTSYVLGRVEGGDEALLVLAKPPIAPSEEVLAEHEVGSPADRPPPASEQGGRLAVGSGVGSPAVGGSGRARADRILEEEEEKRNEGKLDPLVGGRRLRSWREIGSTEPPAPREAPIATSRSADRTTPAGRKVSARELALLESVSAKKAAGRLADLTADEIVEAWRENFFSRFGHADIELERAGDRRIAARAVSKQCVQWFGGDRAAIQRYLKRMLGWWAERKERGERFPSAAAPHLSSLLSKGTNGGNVFVDEWHRLERAGARG